jgi:hypothetical protein
MVTEDLTTMTGWEAFKARHGGDASPGTMVNEGRDESGRRLPDPFFHYVMRDGTTIDINGAGVIKAIDEKAPTVATGTLNKPYTPIQDFEIVRDPTTGRPIKLRDPNNPTFLIDLPNSATADKPTLHSYAGGLYSWDGTNLNEVRPPTAQEPTTRTVGDRLIQYDPVKGWQEVYRAPPDERTPTTKEFKGTVYQWDPAAKQWVTAPGIPPAPADETVPTTREYNGQLWQWDPTAKQWKLAPGVTPAAAKPNEGDTRDTVVQGQIVRQKYQGGEWIVDPTVAPKPFDPNKPQEGVTRQAIESGYNVTQTYTGGEWVTTSIGTRAVPQPRQAVSAPADQPYITQFDPNTNQTVTVPNPNYQPKTVADVAAQVGRLRQQAQAKRDELSKKIADQSMTPEQAAAEFDTWYQQNIESQKGTLETIQRQAALEEARKQDEAMRANLAAAQAAGRQAADIAGAERRNMVGPGWGQAVNAIMRAFQTGKGIQGNIDWGAATTYTAPSLQSLAEQATANFLQHLSPTAASIAGGGTPGLLQQPLDISTLLSANQYRPALAAPITGGVVTGATGATDTSAVVNPNFDVLGQYTYRPPAPEEVYGARGPLM